MNNNKFVLPIIAVVALLAGIGIGIVGRNVVPEQIKPGPGTPPTKITQAELPLPISILKNPLVYEWRGSVEGTLTKKSKTEFTLSKDGNEFTVKFKEGYTKFIQIPPGKEILLENIAEGTFLRGVVVIVQKGGPQLSGNPEDAIGEIFRIQSNIQQ